MAYDPDRDSIIYDQLLAAIEYLISDGIEVNGITLDPDVDIGDVHVLDLLDAKIDPPIRSVQDAISATVGTTTDAPTAGEGAEDATAKSHTSLLKRVVNKLIDVKALLIKGTAAMAASIGVTIATDDTVIGATTAVAVDGDTAGSVSQKLRGINKVLALSNTKLGTTGGAADIDGGVTEQLHYLGENIDQVHVSIEELSATATWAASTDASGITQEGDHVATHAIANSLSMDKSGATVTEGSYSKTITSVDGSELAGDSLVTFFCKLTDLTNIAEVFVRIGSSAGNYNQYGIDPELLSTTLWNHVTISLHDGIQTGTGLDLSAITYVAFGVIMDATGNTTGASVFFNALELHSVTASELQVSGDVTSNAVRVTKVGSSAGSVWPKDAGNSNSGTPRIVIASDDVLTAAIKAAVGNRDDVFSGNMWRVDVTNTSGTLATKISGNLAATTTGVYLVPIDDTVEITMEHGAAASGSTPRIPAGGMAVPCTNTVGDAFAFWVAAGTEELAIFELIPR